MFFKSIYYFAETRPTHLIHMETIDEDISCYLETKGRINLDLDKSDLENFFHVNKSPDGHSSKEKIKKKYFGQLSKKLMQNFYDRYKEDFLLHGYKIESYFSYATDIDDNLDNK